MTHDRRGAVAEGRLTRAAVALLVALACLACNAEFRVFGPGGEVARFGGSSDTPPPAGSEAPPPPEPAPGAEARETDADPAQPPREAPTAPAMTARADAGAQPGWTATGPPAAEPAEVKAEPATFHSLAVRWPIRGDSNANAAIRVQYRQTGEPRWREAWPLFRTHPTRVSPDNRVPDGWLFAGSIVDLVPDTEYEVRLTLADPDGGNTERQLVMRTRGEPRAPADMRVRHVTSGEPAGGGTGAAADPFRGLAAAQAAAQPGDLFLLHAGTYAGGFTIDRRGAPGRPIVYRAAGDGPVVLDGGGAERLVNAQGAQHVWLEGLTFRNARYLVLAHRAAHLVIRRSTFEVVRYAISAFNGGYDESQGFVFTDNVFRGPSTWPRSSGIEDVNAVTISGAGHVVAYNFFTGLADGIHGTSHGRLSATDYHNNDFDVCTDDAIEADYGDTNVRVFRNRITNCFVGVSSQPTHGGPLYVFRNSIYNVQYSPFKLHNDTAGVLLFHNTSMSAGIPFHIQPGGETVSDVISRNNIYIGMTGPALRSTGEMIRCDFDNDGYAWGGGSFALWNRQTYLTARMASRAGDIYRVHGMTTVSVRSGWFTGVEPPRDVRHRYPAQVHDLRITFRSAASDRGIVLANFSDGFVGRAPDLGCCELGEPLPVYGPRPLPAR
ncbi:MAG: right-handed parallel beta-helix repeat-containing protein [Candidatus Rokuibacteriota bacterium]